MASEAIERYRQRLGSTADRDAYLLAESRLPGRRGNLELAQAATLVLTKADLVRYARIDAAQAPENTARSFLAFCGVLGLGRLLAEGDRSQETALRRHARDRRWRIREAVAMALQIVGDHQPSLLHAIARRWMDGGWLEHRAAVAAVAEPRLLDSRRAARSALRILDRATRNPTRSDVSDPDGRRVLRQALGYAWSVVVAAIPAEGKAAMQAWIDSDNEDVRWVMRQNLGKARLRRLDPAWCQAAESRLALSARRAGAAPALDAWRRRKRRTKGRAS